MKHCQNCGNQLHDQAVVCTNCGCACAAPQPTYQNYAPNNAGYQPNITQPNPYQQTAYQPNHYQPVVDKESSSTANCALIFAILMPVVGLICGIVGVCKYKTSAYKTRCIIAIVLSVLVWILGMLIISGM